MSDVSITATAILGVGDIGYGILGATITAGQPIYLDSAAANVVKAAQDTTAAKALCAGIALNGGVAGQPVAYLKNGNLTANAGFTKGVAYYVSDNAGGIAPFADLGTGDFVTFLGIATSTTVLRLMPFATGVQL